jgi:hypothetical protein
MGSAFCCAAFKAWENSGSGSFKEASATPL